MMRATAFALLVALFVVGSFADYDTNITAVNANGFDVIVLDEPSWATHIQRSYGTHEFFVFGERTLRTVKSGPNTADFFAEPIVQNNGLWKFPLIDLHTTFFNTSIGGQNVTVRMTMGIADNAPSNDPLYTGAVGAYTPLFSVAEYAGATPMDGPKVQPTKSNTNTTDFTGHLSYGVRVDPRNIANNDIVTYFAGYVLGTDSNNNPTLTFGITRTHYNPQPGLGAGNRVYNFNSSVDWFPFYSNQFTTFSATYRPFVHYYTNISCNNAAGNCTYVVVIDPNTQSVYSVNVDYTVSSANTPVEILSLGASLADNDVVSNSIDFENNIMWVGVSSSGFAPGYIYKITFGPGGVPAQVNWPLPANYSNPKALANDGNFLYIGMNGYSEVLKMDYTGKVVGYQRLPDYLHRNWDAIATFHHVYFITYEQNSKIYRVSKDDFCPAACPYNGYCKGGSCTCSHGYVMNSAKSECLLQAATQVIAIKHHYTVAHDGEIVLGVFFALAVIVAAAGWFQWYKARRSAYQAV